MISIFNTFDLFWCGSTQLPASLILQITDRKQVFKKLIFLRIFVAFCFFLEIVGLFLITLGLFSQDSSSLLILGIGMKIFGGLFCAQMQNRAGVILSLELQESLKSFRTHFQEISSLLADKGCSESEISSLHNLPSDVYQSELASCRKASLSNILAPFSCCLGLLVGGEYWSAAAVITLGMLSFPIGEYFFREYSFRHDNEMRLARSAKMVSYLKEIYQKHIALTLRVNALSQLPLLLFGLRFLCKDSGHLLAVFFGMTQGLACLTGTLSFQRVRVTSLRSTQVAINLIKTLANENLIITPSRWRQHCEASKIATPHLAMIDFTHYDKLKSGVILQQFSAKGLVKERGAQGLFPITCWIPKGGGCILQAPSGRGKTTLLAAIFHLIEHSGDLFFIENGHLENVHHMERDFFEDSIVFFKEENIEKSARIVDLFKNIPYPEWIAIRDQARTGWGEKVASLAWDASDNLIETEIQNLLKHNPSVFPQDFVNTLQMMREARIITIETICKAAGGNLATERIFPERIFSTLSAGEKRRLLCTLSLESALLRKMTKLIILDEPLAHLDADSIQKQIESIQRFQLQPNAPALLLISHQHIEELSEKMTASQILTL